jgi:cellulose synthase/poly-beta-1,6-N-acetylglucosamine synthase-like glycosyltransferase
MLKKGTLISAILILCLFIALFWLMPTKPGYLSFGLGVGTALFLTLYFVLAIAQEKRHVKGAAFWIPVVSLSLLSFFLPAIFAAALYLWGMFSILTWVLLIALTFTFFFNFLCVPLALYHKQQEARDAAFFPDHYPSVTVLIPAYNEEKVLGRTIESVIEASYPYKEIIVIDDGSTDRTYQIALGYGNQGVKTVQRPNGGKAAALNYGLLFARGEIVVTVDADSLIGKNALVELVKNFRDPEVAAVAGNIKVINRKNLLTNCQALEYISGINIFRRALAIFSNVTVVPGCLGAYRREVLSGGGFYDPDTLVEDFDTTVKTLKAGKIVQASSAAVCYTEAPETWGDFIKQRLRWYRGNFQALWKHHDAALNPRFGFLQKLSYPYMVLSMIFIPLAGLVVIASVILAILNEPGIWFLYIFFFFLALQFLLSVLAIQLDEEDMQLALYSPFFVFGYKHFGDFIMLKSLFDILLRRKIGWTRARRIGIEPPKPTKL